MDKPELKALHVMITEDQWVQLKERAFALRIPLTEYMREVFLPEHLTAKKEGKNP